MMIAAAAAFGFTLPTTPAFAQGSLSPFPVSGAGCPTGWTTGGNTTRQDRPDPKTCYPRSSSAPLAYANPSRKACAEGYTNSFGYCYVKKEEYSGPSAADQLVSYGTITKGNKLDRCPLGHFSKSDMTTCTTWLSPAPKSRRKAGACRANEIDEWGLYCTADANVITRQQAEDEANRDFNAIYGANGATSPTQDGGETSNSAPMIAAYGPKGKGGGSSASVSSSSSSDTESAPAANCTTTSTTGSAIGGMLGGQAGAALGGMLGGKSKKKKNGC